LIKGEGYKSLTAKRKRQSRKNRPRVRKAAGSVGKKKRKKAIKGKKKKKSSAGKNKRKSKTVRDISDIFGPR